MTATTHRPRVCVLHTVTALPAVFSALLQQEAPGVDAYHVVDESLLADTVAHGMLPRTVRRVASYAALAEEAGASAVLVTCSSIGGAAELARPHVAIPVLRVDEPMARQAVRTGRRIGVLATLSSTLGPTEDLIRRTAADEGADVEIATSLCPGAHAARTAGDTAEHDRLIAAEAERLAACADILVLAQASMAQAVGKLPAGHLTVPVLTSPQSGAAQLATLPAAQAAAR
ncbi:aspartate/glutamate racemase family protein [Streptomyces sp. NPDC047009]|uniref:aspartate/glutamate racemase family protein n=1 Tax=Streptomyces sp. NPDC047009 TaxID=3154496 RepID=UPI0033BFDFDD